MNRINNSFIYRIFFILFFVISIAAFTAGCEINFSDEPNANNKGNVTDLHNLKLASEYTGEPYIELNNNKPEFEDSDKTGSPFEVYSDLDKLGRCGVAYANICRELMPTEKRGSISKVKPSGWQSVRYDCVEGKSLYNRCHLIGFQLAGENANRKNLITGTRSFNVDGMLPFEDMVADYVKRTGNHVLYRVTPVYEGENLVAEGVQMEALSVEDDGDGVCFNVFVYNVQQGIAIDYATGNSSLVENGSGKDSLGAKSKINGEKNTNLNNLTGSNKKSNKTSEKNGSKTIKENNNKNTAKDYNSNKKANKTASKNSGSSLENQDYVINTNTGKFHYPYCSSVNDMLPKNREDYKGNRQQLVEQGFEPCKRCNP